MNEILRLTSWSMLVVLLMLGCLLTKPSYAQQDTVTQIVLSGRAPATVDNFGGAFAGDHGGNTTIYYWIIAKYPIGDSGLFGPLVIPGTFGRQNLNASNVVNLNWSAAPGATGYDVVYNVVNAIPEFPCASCGVVLNTATTTYVDNGTGNHAYSGPDSAGEAKVTMNVNNRDESEPYVPVSINGALHRLGLSAVQTPVNGCAQWANGLIVSTGVACGGGGPGTVTSVFGRVGAVVAAASDYDADQVDNTPAGTVAATNVQAAIDELDTEKIPVSQKLGTGAGVPAAAALGTSGNCARWAASGIEDAGVSCGAGGIAYGSVTFTLDGGGSVVTTGDKSWVRVPYNGVITGYELTADQSGSIVVDIWKDTYTNFPPTVADTITAAAKPTLSGAQKSSDTTLTGWTKSVSAGDYLLFHVDSASTVTRVVLSLQITKD